MGKKILIGIGVLFVLFVAWSLYGLFLATPASPPATAEGNNGDLSVAVNYSRPYKKGRLIFGSEADGALQPYGKYWRMGANAATEITFNKDITFAGEPVKAGSYRMYAIPGPDAWEVLLNSELGVFFGASEPNHELDVVKVRVPVQTTQTETEQFTITFPSDSTGMKMNLVWDKTLIQVPINQ